MKKAGEKAECPDVNTRIRVCGVNATSSTGSVSRGVLLQRVSVPSRSCSEARHFSPQPC